MPLTLIPLVGTFGAQFGYGGDRRLGGVICFVLV